MRRDREERKEDEEEVRVKGVVVATEREVGSKPSWPCPWRHCRT